MTAPTPGCAGHSGVSAELRSLAHAVLDRLEPALDRWRAEAPPSSSAPDAPGSSTPPCAVCPVCAVVAALRGERPELVARLGEQLDGLIALARDALAEPGPPPPERTASGSPKRVQRIPVVRVGAGG